jgi:hypothetical protein
MNAVGCRERFGQTMIGVSMALAGLLITASPARAGGTWLEPEESSYRPGDQAFLTGTVSAGQLGWVDDGPFFAYLRVEPATAAEAEARADTFPFIHSTDLFLAEMEVVNFTTAGGPGAAQVSLTFEVPAIDPGEYAVVYCNQPCTDGFGDLMGGFIEIHHRPNPGLTSGPATGSQSPFLPATHLYWAVPAGVVLAAGVVATALYSRRHSHAPLTAPPTAKQR